mmetsp:Transcript_69911/g.185566  ORF Transcript_69911/g.185566 Transcript_69911/m.185566 type:complete len:205 (+) Transcript_69911:857-1471(+)
MPLQLGVVVQVGVFPEGKQLQGLRGDVEDLPEQQYAHRLRAQRRGLLPRPLHGGGLLLGQGRLRLPRLRLLRRRGLRVRRRLGRVLLRRQVLHGSSRRLGRGGRLGGPFLQLGQALLQLLLLEGRGGELQGLLHGLLRLLGALQLRQRVRQRQVRLRLRSPQLRGDLGVRQRLLGLGLEEGPGAQHQQLAGLLRVLVDGPLLAA